MSTRLTDKGEYPIVASVQVPQPQGPAEQDQAAPDAAALVALMGVEKQFSDVLQLTKKLFPGEVRVGADFDPECPQARFVEFQVTSSHAVDDILQRQREWNRGVLRLAPAALNFFRLSVAPA